jgi:hypothetical protein
LQRIRLLRDNLPVGLHARGGRDVRSAVDVLAAKVQTISAKAKTRREEHQ